MLNNEIKKIYFEKFGVSEKVLDIISQAEAKCADIFEKADKIAELNQLKVLSAMQKHHLAEAHFASTTGYGYNDLGRDALEAVYAEIFKAEDALVRPQLISGTHALTVALAGNLRPNDELFSPVGLPYDTLQGVIGIRPERGCLAEYGITFKSCELLPDGGFDYEAIKLSVGPNTKMALIQRSKGYSLRRSLRVEQIGELIRFLKNIKPDIIVLVDNCYGEFVEAFEPLEVGADLIAGSLIKNPGGGLAPSGGYIAGKKELVENAAARLSSPGIGKEAGPTLGALPAIFQGLFMAPQIVCAALKGAVLAAKVFDSFGYFTEPRWDAPRADIVQAIALQSADHVIEFCRAIQAAAPVDSFVVPEPWEMPGYDVPVIMAAGSFISGSSIELSADSPIKPPYAVFFQGGLSYHHAKAGVSMAAAALINKFDIKLNI